MIKFFILIFLIEFYISLRYAKNEVSKIIEKHLHKPHHEVFKIWKQIYKRPYSLHSNEGLKKFSTFSNNLMKIKEHNLDNTNTYKLELNQFADLTHEEVKMYHKGRLQIEIPELKDFIDEEELNWEPIDWRPIMTPVRDQGNCNSWWAFSVTGMLEALYWIKNKNNKNIKNVKNEWLSPQQAIDCQTKMSGCDGGYFPGDIDLILNYYKVRNAMRDNDYNFTQKTGYMCYYDESKIKHLGISNVKKATNSTQIYELLKKGPVLTAVGQNSKFLSYTGGIFDGKDCESTRYNMGALLVGYGEENGESYWIIRLSRGNKWGENGYIKIKKDSGNDCFITQNGYQVELK